MEPTFLPLLTEEIRARLQRRAWKDFPNVVIHAEESFVKKHRLYNAAKSGDLAMAEALIAESVSLRSIATLNELVAEENPLLLPVQAVEAAGLNLIPRALAQTLSDALGLTIDAAVWQINRVQHTGADGYYRLASPALFDGEVKSQKYLLVDDFIGQGGTLANLKGFVESQGAQVIGATTLTGKSYSATLNLAEATLQELRGKYGTELEQWWITTFGYGFECLTESEARYLIRADDADTIATRLAAAVRS